MNQFNYDAYNSLLISFSSGEQQSDAFRPFILPKRAVNFDFNKEEELENLN